MAKQTKKEKPAKAKKTEEVVEAPAEKDKSLEEKKADWDAILDDIEGVLEENAETFVNEYRQRGGQ